MSVWQKEDESFSRVRVHRLKKIKNKMTDYKT